MNVHITLARVYVISQQIHNNKLPTNYNLKKHEIRIWPKQKSDWLNFFGWYKEIKSKKLGATLIK